MDTPLQTALRKAFNSKLSLIPQTLTPEQKAQVLKNLEGTFLPLSGGTLTGNIIATRASLFAISNQNEDGSKTGSQLILKSPEDGSFELKSYDPNSGSAKTFAGRPDGTLAWMGKEIIRLESFTNKVNYPSAQSWQHCMRFSNGVQISYGLYAQDPSPQQGATVTFVLPFTHAPSITISCFGPDYVGGDLNLHLTNPESTRFKFWSTWNNWHYWQAFGMWK